MLLRTSWVDSQIARAARKHSCRREGLRGRDPNLHCGRSQPRGCQPPTGGTDIPHFTREEVGILFACRHAPMIHAMISPATWRTWYLQGRRPKDETARTRTTTPPLTATTTTSPLRQAVIKTDVARSTQHLAQPRTRFWLLMKSPLAFAGAARSSH